MLEVAMGFFYRTSQISVIIWDHEKGSDGNQHDMIQICRMTVELPENSEGQLLALQSWMLSRPVGKAKETHVRQRERKMDIETRDKN